MKKWLAGVISAVILVLPVTASAHGADTDEHISSFDSQVVLTKDARVAVTETIEYDFGNQQKHGILREIPTTYHNGSDDYYLTFSGGTVTDETGANVPAQKSDVTDGISLKIGDADKLVTGTHVYKISYALAPIILAGTDIDQLLFDVTGNATSVQTEAASVTVKAEEGLMIRGQKCFTGAQGESGSDCTIIQDGQSIAARTIGVLGAGQGLTINVDFAHGGFTTYLQANKKPPTNPIFLIIILAYGLLFLGCIGYFIRRWYKDWSTRRAQTIIPEYEAPAGLKPGELGMLLDNKTGMPEITATMIDLSVRGYMKIEQISKKGLLTAAKYQFIKLKDDDGLQGYEQRLFNEIFASGTTVKLSDLDQAHMAKVVTDIKKTIKDDLIEKGYYRRGSVDWRIIAAIVIVVLPIFFFAIFIAVFVLIAVIGGGLSLTTMTASGYAEWAKVKGFKWFLTVTEADRLKFSDAPDKTPELFNKLLPAAVALGVEKEWAKQFEGIDIAKATGWYGSPDPFTAAILVNSLSNDFGSAVSSGFAAPSSGGSSFSGGGSGGSSGGGFGGGGTGSW